MRIAAARQSTERLVIDHRPPAFYQSTMLTWQMLVGTVLSTAILLGACRDPDPGADRSDVLDLRRGAGRVDDHAGLVSLFDSLDRAWNGGAGCSRCTNEQGRLAWGESYLLRAYLDMYYATEETRYLEKFEAHALRVAESTDRTRGVVDWKGRSLVGWSATKYSHGGERIVIPVNSAMIVLPFLQFVQLVRSDSSLDTTFSSTASELLTTSMQAVGQLDRSYRYSPVTGEANTAIEFGAPIGGGDPSSNRHYALNSDAAIGRAYLRIAELTGDPVYRRRAIALGRHLKSELMVRDSAYVWHYYCKEGRRFNPRWEDISHGAVEIGFAADLQQHGVVFDIADIRRFVGTLKGMQKGRGFTEFVTGKGEPILPTGACPGDRSQMRGDALGRWLFLAGYDDSVHGLIEGYLVRRLGNCMYTSGQLMLAVAKLARYAE